MSKEQFLNVYLSLKSTVIFHSYEELNKEERRRFGILLYQAHKVYQDIVQRRVIGTDYLKAALSYFACGDILKFVEERYLLLRVSYFFYKQYEEIAQLPNSKNKQKESLDLLRYIAKPLFEEPQQANFKEAKDLLEFYLDFMLRHDSQEARSKYEKWEESIHELKLSNEKILSYIGTLTILLKRLAQGRIVRRRCRKNKKIVKDWPTESQLKQYRERKCDRRVYLDEATEIALTYDIREDDYGEVEVEEAGLSIHSTDPRTTRFAKIINEHVAHLHRHRQRRLQPFVTNPHYMNQHVIRQLVYLLNLELDSNRPVESAIAAACLLSLTSGLSPVALLQYPQLIKDGVLIVNDDTKHPEYRICLKLEISEQKIEYLKAHRLNHTRTHELYLSSSWFDYIHHYDHKVSITAADVNRYLKKWTATAYLGSITVEKLQAQLYFHVFHDTFNEYIAHVLSGKDSYHDVPGSFYNGIHQQKLNDKYLIYLETIADPETDQTISYIQRKFQTLSSEDSLRLGSQLALKPKFVSDFFNKLHRLCSEQIAIHQHVIQQINSYAIWMWHMSLLCLAGRPKENLLGQLDDYDLKLKALYVNDKKNSRSRKDGRYIPLSKFFIDAFQKYVAFLKQITQRYQRLFKYVFNKTISVNDLFGQRITYSKELPTTDKQWRSKKIKIASLKRSDVNDYLSQYFDLEIYNNWLRHFDMNMLMDQEIAFNAIQALYGHDQRDQELFYRYSSATMSKYCESITSSIDQMIKDLQIEHIS